MLIVVVRKKLRTKPPEPPATLQEWMEQTGTNGRRLLSMLQARGCYMSEGHLSNILKRSRRCSIVKAVLLNELTGVPVRNLIEWPPAEMPARRRKSRSSLASAGA
jgi:hypothetical protein